MNNFSRVLCFALAFVCAAVQLPAQVSLRGEVVDAISKEPLIGAAVMIAGTGEGAVTDFDGAFELRVEALPVTLEASYVGYETVRIEVRSADEPLQIAMQESAVTIDAGIEVVGQRISEKQKAAPLTVESMDVLAIRETPSENFYDGLGAMKGVDLTAASLGFKIVNTRGFNSTSPVRTLQLIDGVDNQAPGLNFSLGNFLGASELDVLRVELVQGASSSFFGPNAFNGVINMQTKDPFYQKGLSVQLKAGERDLKQVALRWADALKNDEGYDWFGYKINFFYLSAYDWVADNYEPVDGSRVPKDNPGRYDAVNRYGDEYSPVNDASTTPPWNDPGLGIFYRTGYKEVDLVDYDTRNLKANAALHFRLRPEQAEQSPELILASSFGNGTTVYQGDNRFSLKGILFFQNRIELRKRDKWFIRAYATHEDAGKSYDPYFTALLLQERAKPDERWGQNYRRFWKQFIVPKIEEYGYPQLTWDGTQFTFDYEAAEQWLAAYHDSLVVWHSQAEYFANLPDMDPNAEPTFEYFYPGTERFQQEFEKITSTKSNREEGGTRFYDKSALYHIQGEYNFKPSWTERLTVGGSGRLYTPESDGTIFSDTAGVRITNYEFGMYAGLEKKLADEKVTLNLAGRIDKNQNFDLVSTQAASVVYKPRPGHFLRASFSSAIRNPTLTDQYLNLNVGRAILLGNITGFDSLITVESFRDYTSCLCLDTLQYFNVAPVQPEKVKTFEVGYRATLFNSLYVDAGYYFSIYTDFLGYNIGIDATFSPEGLPDEIQAYRLAANSKNRVTTQGFAIGLNYYFGDYYMLSGNYSWNRLNVNDDIANDPIIPAFNTPEHKYNIGFSGRNVQMRLGERYIRNFGFSINYKWVQGFVFEGSPQFTGYIPSYNLVDAQVNYTIEKWHTTVKIGASNLLNNLHYETYGGPRIGRLAYITVLYDFKKK